MFHYMLGQLHAYYMILHAFTSYSMHLQALHANPVGPSYFDSMHLHALHANPVGPSYFEIGGSYGTSM